jgi:hypothetical protein
MRANPVSSTEPLAALAGDSCSHEEIAALRQYYEGACALRVATTANGVSEAIAAMNVAEQALWVIRRQAEHQMQARVTIVRVRELPNTADRPTE